MKKKPISQLIPAVLITATLLSVIGSGIYIKAAELSSRKKVDGIAEAASGRCDFALPEGVRVVSLGEATHGNKEFQELKLEVFRKLVNEYDYHVFGLEENFGSALRVDDYICGRREEPDVRALVMELGCYIYHTEDFVRIVEYMKQYNESVPESEMLHFFGFDMQGITDYDTERLMALIEGLPEDAPDRAEMLSIASEIALPMQEDFVCNADSRAQYTPRFEKLKALLATSDLSPFDREMSIHSVDIAIGLLTYYDYDLDSTELFYFRDRNMAANVKWYDDLLSAEGRTGILCTAHNGHVASIDASAELEGALSFGGNLRQIYAGDLYIIGTEYYHSVDNVNDHSHFSHAYTRRDHAFCSADPIAYQAKDYADASFFLDFSEVPEGSEAYAILHAPNDMGIMGEGFVPEDGFCMDNFRTKMVAADAYDAVIYYFEVGPIRVFDVE